MAHFKCLVYIWYGADEDGDEEEGGGEDGDEEDGDFGAGWKAIIKSPKPRHKHTVLRGVLGVGLSTSHTLEKPNRVTKRLCTYTFEWECVPLPVWRIWEIWRTT